MTPTPTPDQKAAKDEQLDQILGRLLQVGVLIAGLVVLIGGVLFIVRHGGEIPDYHQFNEAQDEGDRLTGLAAGIRAGRARSVIQLGLVLLIATPVARVVFSVFAFWLQRDWTYVVVTLIVLTLLLYGLFAGQS